MSVMPARPACMYMPDDALDKCNVSMDVPSETNERDERRE